MKRKWNFSTPRVEGRAARQAYVGLPEGLWGHEMGREGFSSAVVQMYHRNPPSAWAAIDEHLQPRLLQTEGIAGTDSPWSAAELLVNEHMRYRFWRTERSMDHLVRNSDGDELLFIHRGTAEMFCDFGHISLEQGDYFVMPRGTTWRIETGVRVEALLIESTNTPYALPDVGPLGRNMPFDLGVLGVPNLDEQFRSQDRKGPGTVRVKRGHRIGALTYPFNPLDAEGWQGDLYPIRLNMRDIRAIHSYRSPLVPSAYSTFVSDQFVVCSMVPHPAITDPEAIKLPSFHDNLDFDEIMFMHDGDKTHRPGIFRPGVMTHHPRGFTHGPQPAAMHLMNSKEPMAQPNTFIMVETRHPVQAGRDAQACEFAGYAMSWRDAVKFAPDANENSPGSA